VKTIKSSPSMPRAARPCNDPEERFAMSGAPLYACYKVAVFAD
jgi:hypothetical protein